MDAVLGPPLYPAPTTRRTRAVVGGWVLILALALIGRNGQAVPASTPMPSVQTQPMLASAPVVPSVPEQSSDSMTPETQTKQPTALVERAMKFIEPFEDRRHRAYRDSRGYLTIGVGFNLDRAGAADDLNELLPGVNYESLRRGEVSLTDAQIDVLLRHDTQRAIDTARQQVTGLDALPLDAQLIVIDMTFNTGSLDKWRNLRSALARQDYASAAQAMHRSRWRRQTGQRARNHIERMRVLARG